MDILLVATELAPYIVETHAAEAVASLSKSLRLLGHDVTVALPRYPAFEQAGMLAARRLTPLRLESGGEVVLFDAQLPSGVKLVLFDAPRLFDRAGVYGEGGEEYPDNAKRFGFFSDAVAALVQARADQGKTFDVVHLHDYAAGLVAVKLAMRQGATLPTILTVHDGQRSGTFPLKAREDLGISEEFCHPGGYRLGSKLCVLKGVVATVDKVVTTSPSYAEALESPERFGALSRVFREGGGCLGILGGVDYSHYNPATDSALESRYDAEDISNKGRNKSAVVRELNLELEVARPLFLAEVGAQATPDGIAASLRHLLKNELSLILVSDPAHEAKLRKAAAPYEHTVRVLTCPSDKMARRLLAAADFYLGLDRDNPSGLALLRAQRYGAVPAALAVDAALDAVVDCDAELETGTGFLFDSPTQRALTFAVARCLAAYGSPRFPALVRRVARQDLGWDRPARRYAQIYRQILAAHG